MNKIYSIFPIIFGSIFVIFHKSMARYAVNAWMRHFNIKLSEWILRISYLLGGILAIIFGCLILLGIIRLGK